MTVRLEAAAVSDIGPHRAHNQDAAFAAPWAAIVADGVGGGPAGDLASASLVHRLTATARGGEMTARQLDELVHQANWDIGLHSRRDPSRSGMATTLTGVWLGVGGALLLAHTGDSRGYRLRGGRLRRCTRDDSLVQALVDGGLVRAEDAASHPRRNIITASLRGAPDDRVNVEEWDAVPGDRWLLCSDGVTDYLPDEVVGSLLALGDAPAAAGALVQAALRAGSRDNVTAVVADVRDRPAGSAAVQDGVYAGAAASLFHDGLTGTAG